MTDLRTVATEGLANIDVKLDGNLVDNVHIGNELQEFAEGILEDVKKLGQEHLEAAEQYLKATGEALADSLTGALDAEGWRHVQSTYRKALDKRLAAVKNKALWVKFNALERALSLLVGTVKSLMGGGLLDIASELFS